MNIEIDSNRNSNENNTSNRTESVVERGTGLGTDTVKVRITWAGTGSLIKYLVGKVTEKQ